MADNEAVPGTGKAKAFMQKHKTALIVGGVFVFLIIGYLWYRNQNAGVSSSSPYSAGYGGNPPGNPAGAVLQGPPGPPGPEGPIGPRGPRGPVDNDKKKRPKPPRRHVPPRKPISVQPRVHPAIAASNNTVFHTVQPGEQTAGVAARHSMDSSSLYGMNRAVMGGSTQVRPGQRLRVR